MQINKVKVSYPILKIDQFGFHIRSLGYQFWGISCLINLDAEKSKFELCTPEIKVH